MPQHACFSNKLSVDIMPTCLLIYLSFFPGCRLSNYIL